MSSLISIIVPVYNVERYIAQALDSVVAQSYKDLEIILINDGSTDGCGKICDEYAERDHRVKVYHIPNGGVAKARQMGMEISTGEFIAFVDPDDILPHNAIETLYSNMSEDLDIVLGSSTRFYESGKVRYVRFSNRTLSADEWLKMIITNTPDYVAPPWARIYRRTLFTKDSFPRLKRAQDWMMNIELASRVRGVRMIENIVYNYRSPFGTGRNVRVNLQHTKSILGVAEEILRSNGLLDKYRHELNTKQISFIIKCIKNRAYIDYGDEWIQEICRTVQLDRLSPLQRAALRSLKSTNAQRRFRRRIKLNELIEKIKRWTYIYTNRQPQLTI